MRALVTGLAVLCLLWGGVPAPAFAYGTATQDIAYPQVISSEQFAALAKQKIEAQLKASAETRRHELKLQRSPQAMRLPAGSVTCDTRLPKGLPYGGIVPVEMNVYLDGTFYRRVVCYYRLSVYESILVAVHDMKLEQAFTAADVRTEEREVTGVSSAYVHDVSEVLGKVPTQVIKAGQEIRTVLLQMPLVIESGSPVTLVANYGSIQVKTEGVAMQRGRTGKIIRVRNQRSGKILRAKVIDATTVEILNG